MQPSLFQNTKFSHWILLCLICCFFACKKKKTELSIPQEKMIEILADAHIIESTLQTNLLTKRDSTSDLFYQQLYQIHGTSEKEFLENLDILESDAKLMADVYTKVMDQLSKMEADHK